MAHSLPPAPQPKRSKTILSPEGTTAKFLYTIIKQLDLKTIDWNEIAMQLDISNGHAARMRYSRFKSQIEALLKDTRSKAKTPSRDTKVKVKSKEAKCKRAHDDMIFDQHSNNDLFMDDDEETHKRVKHELVDILPDHSWNTIVKAERDLNMPNTTALDIKTEQGTQSLRLHHSSSADQNHAGVLKDNISTTQAQDEHQASKPLSLSQIRHGANSMPSSYAELPSTPVAPNSLAVRPRYHPNMNNIRLGMPRQPFYRPYPGVFPYHYPLRNHYQQPPYASIYGPSSYEMAAQASSPWPYSEANLSQYTARNPNGNIDMKTNVDFSEIDKIDFGRFVDEYGETFGKQNEASVYEIDTTQPTIAVDPQLIQSEEPTHGTNVQQTDKIQSHASLQTQPVQIKSEDTSTSEAIENGQVQETESQKENESNSTSDDVVVKVEPETIVL